MIDAAERKRRIDACNFAYGNVALEGGIMSPDAEAIRDRFIEGELTLDELMAEICHLHKKP